MDNTAANDCTRVICVFMYGRPSFAGNASGGYTATFSTDNENLQGYARRLLEKLLKLSPTTNASEATDPLVTCTREELGDHHKPIQSITVRDPSHPSFAELFQQENRDRCH
jgi:hypothetical protein